MLLPDGYRAIYDYEENFRENIELIKMNFGDRVLVDDSLPFGSFLEMRYFGSIQTNVGLAILFRLLELSQETFNRVQTPNPAFDVLNRLFPSSQEQEIIKVLAAAILSKDANRSEIFEVLKQWMYQFGVYSIFDPAPLTAIAQRGGFTLDVPCLGGILHRQKPVLVSLSQDGRGNVFILYKAFTWDSFLDYKCEHFGVKYVCYRKIQISGRKCPYNCEECRIDVYDDVMSTFRPGINSVFVVGVGSDDICFRCNAQRGAFRTEVCADHKLCERCVFKNIMTENYAYAPCCNRPILIRSLKGIKNHVASIPSIHRFESRIGHFKVIDYSVDEILPREKIPFNSSMRKINRPVVDDSNLQDESEASPRDIEVPQSLPINFRNRKEEKEELKDRPERFQSYQDGDMNDRQKFKETVEYPLVQQPPQLRKGQPGTKSVPQPAEIPPIPSTPHNVCYEIEQDEDMDDEIEKSRKPPIFDREEKKAFDTDKHNAPKKIIKQCRTCNAKFEVGTLWKCTNSCECDLCAAQSTQWNIFVCSYCRDAFSLKERVHFFNKFFVCRHCKIVFEKSQMIALDHCWRCLELTHDNFTVTCKFCKKIQEITPEKAQIMQQRAAERQTLACCDPGEELPRRNKFVCAHFVCARHCKVLNKCRICGTKKTS